MASGSEEKIAKRKSFSNRDFLINLCKETILSLCLIWMAKIAMTMADITMLAIDCSKEGFIDKSDGK